MSARLSVAIIGAGIGGCSAAAYVRDGWPTASIHVFEREAEVGGRVQTVQFHGCTIETGAGFVHSSNVATMALVRRVGLELRERDRLPGEVPRPIAVWDGQRFVVVLESSKLRLAATLLRHYGLSLVRMRNLAGRMLKKWRRVYELQHAGTVFATPEELLRALDLFALTQRSTYHLFEEHRVCPEMVAELFNGVARAIYNQDASINAFAGMIALLGTGMAGGRTLSISGGNAQLCKGLLTEAGAIVRTQCHVSAVRAQTGRAGSGVVVSDRRGHEEVFDAVILAVPGAGSDISVHDGDALCAWTVRQFTQPTHVVCVSGRLRSDYFHAEGEERLPQTILTIEKEQLPFSTILRNGASDRPGEHVYKIQSRRKLTRELLDLLFAPVSDRWDTDWPAAYPILTPVEAAPPFRVSRRIYCASAMESLISTLETQIVGSRNAVGLLRRDLAEVVS